MTLAEFQAQASELEMRARAYQCKFWDLITPRIVPGYELVLNAEEREIHFQADLARRAQIEFVLQHADLVTP